MTTPDPAAPNCPCGSGAAAVRLLQERSRFQRRASRWVYVDGDIAKQRSTIRAAGTGAGD